MVGNPNPVKNNNHAGDSFADILLWPLALVLISAATVYFSYLA